MLFSGLWAVFHRGPVSPSMKLYRYIPVTEGKQGPTALCLNSSPEEVLMLCFEVTIHPSKGQIPRSITGLATISPLPSLSLF